VRDFIPASPDHIKPRIRMTSVAKIGFTRSGGIIAPCAGNIKSFPYPSAAAGFAIDGQCEPATLVSVAGQDQLTLSTAAPASWGSGVPPPNLSATGLSLMSPGQGQIAAIDRILRFQSR